jgi:hypothetical protein
MHERFGISVVRCRHARELRQAWRRSRHTRSQPGRYSGAVLLAASLLAGTLPAATRAWLNQNTVALGEPVTLSIETDQGSVKPDLTPLRGNFSVGRQSSSRQVQMSNGSITARSVFEVLLVPLQAGELTLPALSVGAETTSPLRLSVTAAASTSTSTTTTQGDEVAFVRTLVDDRHPYVQQNVGVTVQLYYTRQLASGELVLDAPAGSTLLRIGDDVKSEQQVNGRAYQVIERHFLLVADRSGPLLLPGARFAGQAVGGMFDDFFGHALDDIRASSAGTELQVRPRPPASPQPWLPLRALQWRYSARGDPGPVCGVAGIAGRRCAGIRRTGAVPGALRRRLGAVDIDPALFGGA